MWSIETQALPRTAVIGSIVDWTPYLAGVGIGLLSWIVFVVVDDPIGITTAFSAVAGAVAMPFLGADAVWSNSYWKLTPPSLSYGTLFLLGVMLGGLWAALSSKQFRVEYVPAVWKERFGPSVPRRFGFAFLGGAVEMFGARLAGGCTSGHSISGGLQLAVSSWEFTLVAFATAVATALLLFRKPSPRVEEKYP
jgi:uncharacterized membrane protein YedE/YeeE